jgi:hypothetical protein
MRASKLYPFSIPANGSIALLVEGDYFKIQSCTGLLSVTGDSFGTIDQVLPGQGLRETDFRRLTLTDRTGAVNNGFVLVSDSTFVDDRITGTVSILDSNRDLVISNQSFFGQISVAAVAGQFSLIQLWNPVGSGKFLEVDNVFVSARAPVTAGQIYVQQSAASPLLTLVGNCGSQYFTGAVSSAELRWVNTASAISGFISTPSTVAIVKDAPITVNTDYERLFKRPILIPPNSGLLAYITTVQAGLICQYSFVERVIS